MGNLLNNACFLPKACAFGSLYSSMLFGRRRMTIHNPHQIFAFAALLKEFLPFLLSTQRDLKQAKATFQYLLLFLVPLLLVTVVLATMTSLARIRIVAISDVYELSNLPRVQTFLAKLTTAPTAVVLAGDFISPSTLSSFDGGRGMVATLRAMGLTHVSFGNHEQDLPLESLRQRLNDLSKSATVLNSNLRTKVPVNARWIHNITHPYSIIRSPCNQVKVALLGLLSDEPGIFRDNTFKRIPIGNVLDTYSNLHQQLIPTGQADLLVPLTHESIVRDRELAKHMLTLDSAGVIIGGHEHQPYDEFIRDANRSELSGVRITKSGMDANSVSLIDLTFEVSSDGERPKLAEIEYKLMEIKNLDPSFVVQKVVDKHMSVIKAMEDEYIIDGDTTNLLPPGVPLSSERTQFQQTTVGSIFCQMIKDEMEVDVAVVNGATFKGQKRYENNKISYAELKKELPFPTKLVVVPMKRWELEEAIHYSRTAYGNGTDLDAEEIPRKGFLQVDWAFDQMGETNGGHDDVLQVALPRNLLNGFCKIAPLMDIGARLNKEGTFPGTDDYVPAIDLIVRHLCKNRWYQIINRFTSFEELDLNNDGVLDRDEIKQMMKRVIGHEPADFVIDDMIASIDTDGNGVIDMGEFSYLLATMEREKNQW